MGGERPVLHASQHDDTSPPASLLVESFFFFFSHIAGSLGFPPGVFDTDNLTAQLDSVCFLTVVFSWLVWLIDSHVSAAVSCGGGTYIYCICPIFTVGPRVLLKL